MGFKPDIIQEILKFPHPLYPRYKYSYPIGLRFDIPALKRDFEILINLPPANVYQLQSFAISSTGYKDGDSFSLKRNNDVIFEGLYTKELPQKIKVSPLVDVDPLQHVVKFIFHNDTGSSKVIWFDLDFVSQKLVDSSMIPTVKIVLKPNYIEMWSDEADSVQFDVYYSVYSDLNGYIKVNDSATWSITPDTPLTINKGKISGINAANQNQVYSINATVNQDIATGQLKVKEVPVYMYIEPAQDSVYIGDTVQFDCYVLNPDRLGYTKSNELVTWKTTYGLIDKGLVSQLNDLGTYTITAQYNGKSTTAQLTVGKVPIYILPAQQSVNVSGTAQFDCYVLNDDGKTYTKNNSAVTWTTEIGNISNGLVSDIGDSGHYKVTATYQGYTASADLVVVALPVSHGYDYAIKITWPSGDVDLHAVFDNSQSKHVYYGNDTYEIDDNNKCWLDVDKRNGGSEILTILGKPGNKVNLFVVNYGSFHSGSVSCQLLNNEGKVLRVYTVSQSKIPNDGSSFWLWQIDLTTDTITNKLQSNGDSVII